ncbi:MAG: S9 family peptidase [Paraprevotella sp.]|nr:S9 family peptidase [Paraprevotella sp.]
MRKTSIILLLCAFFISLQNSYGKELTIADLCKGTYSAKRISGVNPLNDGETYSQLSADRKQIVKYSFKNGKQLEVIFDVATARNVSLKGIDGYIMSPDEKNILIQTETKAIYRRSFTAVYYLYNIANRTLVPLSTNGAQQCPKFSPDGHLVAFVRDNNLFLVKLLFNNSESQITTDGKFNEVINGIPDWVNEEEFSTNCSFDFNADNTMIAWIRYDESQVSTFSFPWYKGSHPAKNQYAEYPGRYEYKYPMAGTTNSTVSVHTFDIKARVTRTMKLPLEEDGYIPRIHFTSDPQKLAVFTLNKHQDCLEVYMANPRSTECKKILRDNVDKYINENVFHSLAFYPNRFVLMSERNGYNQLYLYDFNGSVVKKVNSGTTVVKTFYGYDTNSGNFYYSACETDTPMQTHIYCTDSKGKTSVLSSRQEGSHSAIFSKNMKYYMDVYSNINTPYITSLCDHNGKTLKVMEDNGELCDKLKGLKLGQREFFTFMTGEGIVLNGYMVKPADFDATKKYPVIIFQYSGPGSQQVIDSWGAGNMGGTLYEQYLAQEGFISVCIDGRGTGGRGAEFEKCTYLRLGLLEAKDQVELALYLGKQSYVDAGRIGIWGWSYGGFCTLMSMSEGRPVFAAGVAVAAPTNYRFYDTVYTERFMRTPKENEDGYNDNPMTRADKLHGKLLICHGTADDNVHFRNAMEYAESLVQANKPFMMLPYNNRNHNIFGGNTRIHLFTSITNFFKESLK